LTEKQIGKINEIVDKNRDKLFNGKEYISVAKQRLGKKELIC
jgi:hypothetical protein